MTVTLRPITRDNLRAVLRLRKHPSQEGFAPDNAASIAVAYVEPTFVPLVVYAGEEPVGFVMYGPHPDTGAWWVLRLMIDREQQGRGYGRAAMEALIELMAERVGCAEIVTSCVPSNTVAAGLYASLGFRPTGEIEDDEPLVCLQLADRRSPRD